MNFPKKILYIQHAGALGGSCTSLLYTLRGLDKKRYQPVLALANEEPVIIDFYKSAGLNPIPWPGITFWNYTTAGYHSLYRVSGWLDIIKVIRSWRAGKQRTLELVKLVKPDLVHLNSVVLSASAVALAQAKIPFVWHIREHPPLESLGIRMAIIRHLMSRCPNELIFISEANRRAWLRDQRGQVIYNFVDFRQFDRYLNGATVRNQISIPTDAPVILYLGGLRKIKGIFPLVKALSILKKQLPQLYCLMPDSEYAPPNNWQLNLARALLPLVGSGTVGQRVIKNIAQFGLEKVCLRLPFQKNIAPLIAACDVLVFPAITPHFARPIIEASAMAKPVVASRLDGIEELVKDGETGLLVEPNNPEALAKNILAILTNRGKAKQMGETGYIYAKAKFSAEDNCHRIMEIYDRVLAKTDQTIKNSFSIKVGKYNLGSLISIRQDDIPSLLGPKPGVYICDCPESEWYQHFGFKERHCIGIVKKKQRMFSQMANRSKWVSPTNDVPKGKHTQIWKNGNILHLSYIALPWRLGQILQTIMLFRWLWRHRREYEYCLVYDFYLPVFLAPLAVKIFLRKKLYIDYEDDYTKQRKNFFKNFSENLMRKTVDGAICINEHMIHYFGGKPVRVFNAFADLKYAESIDFSLRDNMVFLFSSTLDAIRGVELIPDLVKTLRQHIKNFKILITGDGPLRSMVENWDYPEVKYLGFLDDATYTQTIRQIDACLVLQKPDHPFSLGSFPSKVDEYAQFQKPIFILKKV